MGDHRLLCGDATNPEDLERLVGDAGPAQLLFTDPPYGVEYSGKTESALTIENDNLGMDGTRALVRDALVAVRPHLAAGAAFYVCAPSGDLETAFRLALADAGLRLRQALVWVKDQFVLGRMDFHWRHESLLYGALPGGEVFHQPDPEADFCWRHESVLYGWTRGSHEWNGGRRQDTVWEVPRPKASREHPTMKPVELVARAIVLSTQPGALILDPFAGSGTSVIAAQQLGRRCLALELDPAYCDVIVQRWEEFTGLTAERG